MKIFVRRVTTNRAIHVDHVVMRRTIQQRRQIAVTVATSNLF